MSYIDENIGMFTRIIKGIARQFGTDCEVVLHDLSLPFDRTIVAIENGYITNRKIGDSGTNLGLEVLRGTQEGVDRYNYVNRTNEGRILRSTSVYINDPEGTLCGSICMNFDVTNLVAVQRSLTSLASVGDKESQMEFFTGNIDELLDLLLNECKKNIGKEVGEMTKEDKVSAVKFLDEKGVFLVKKSMEKVAAFFNMSKFSIYNYLDDIRQSS